MNSGGTNASQANHPRPQNGVAQFTSGSPSVGPTNVPQQTHGVNPAGPGQPQPSYQVYPQMYFPQQAGGYHMNSFGQPQVMFYPGYMPQQRQQAVYGTPNHDQWMQTQQFYQQNRPLVQPNTMQNQQMRQNAPNQGIKIQQPTTAAPVPPPTREKKILTIVNPETNKQIEIEERKREVKTPVPVTPAPTPSAKPVAPVKESKAPEATPVTTEKKAGETDSVADEIRKQFFESVLQRQRASQESATGQAQAPKKEVVVEEKHEEEDLEDSTPAVTIEFTIKNNKKTYRIEDLLKLKEYCTDVPEIFVEKGFNIDMTMASQAVMRPVRGSAFSGNNSKFTKIQRQSSNSSGASGGKWSRGGGSNSGGGRKSNKVFTPSIPLEPIMLAIKNAWKPNQNTSDADPNEKYIGEVRGLLNKISREMFQKLSQQMAELYVPSLRSWMEALGLIHEKALTEQKFADMYADLCFEVRSRCPVFSPENKKHHLDFVEVVEIKGSFFWTTATQEYIDAENEKIENPEEMKSREEFLKGPFDSEAACQADVNKVTSMKRVILSLCQGVFEEENKYADLFKEEIELNNKIATSATEEERGELRVSLSDVKYKIQQLRQRNFGNTIFIGELFKKELLSPKILCHCISKLAGIAQLTVLSDMEIPDPENVECLCKIITTVGPELSRREEGIILTAVLKRLTEFTQNKKLDSRHRFMCKDVLDFAASGWKNKITHELEAKTIKEIHADARREEDEKQRKAMEAARTARTQVGRFPSAVTKSLSGMQLGNRPKQGDLLRNKPKILSKGSSPALQPSAESLLTHEEKERYRSKVKSSVAEYINTNLVEEVIQDISEIQSEVPYLQRNKVTAMNEILVEKFISLYIEETDKERKAVPKLLQILVEKSMFESGVIIAELEKYNEVLVDLVTDVPLAGKHFGCLIAELVHLKLHTTDDMKKLCKNLSPSVVKSVVASFFNALKDFGIDLSEDQDSFVSK